MNVIFKIALHQTYSRRHGNFITNKYIDSKMPQ